QRSRGSHQGIDRRRDRGVDLEEIRGWLESRPGKPIVIDVKVTPTTARGWLEEVLPRAFGRFGQPTRGRSPSLRPPSTSRARSGQWPGPAIIASSAVPAGPGFAKSSA